MNLQPLTPHPDPQSSSAKVVIACGGCTSSAEFNAAAACGWRADLDMPHAYRCRYCAAPHLPEQPA